MSSNFLNHDYGSEEEDDDFNPAPAADTDNEQDAKGGSDEEADSKPPRRQINDDEDEDENEASRPAGRDDDDEEQNGSEEDAEGGGENLDDDEDEDDDDEEAVTGRPKKRRRRGGLNAFFEEEAEVDEDDDAEDLDEEDMVDGFVAETHPDDLAALPAGAENDDRRHRELDRRRELEASMDAEKQAQALKERYGRNRQAASDAVVVPKRLLLPSVDDPSIWGVRCKPGKEREVVFSLQKRIEERPPGSRKPCKVISAFERGGTMAGYVYVEARRQADVLDALEEMLNVYPRSKMVLVPVKEMPDLLRVQKSEELVPGGWVRIKRGKYQNDLGQIEEVETNGLEVTLRLVPRLEYGLNEDSNAPINGGDAKRKRHGGANNPVARPPQRLFSEAEAKKKHARYLTATSGLGGKSWNYFGDTYIDGFLIKDFKVQHLITKNVNPQLDEVTKFARGADDGTSNLDLAALAASLKNTAAEETFLPGDMVEVFGGEQQGVIGRTVSTRGDIVTLRVTEGELDGQTIDAPVKTLRKRFREGDHVKVIGGSRYRDELGMVVRIKDDRVTVLSDMSMQEITVFSKDLREAADSGTDGRLGRFDIHDLVQLDASTVACVVKVDRESMRVLDQNGSIRSILPSQVTNKILPRRNAVATDRSGAEIRHGDTVREIYGEQKVGVVLHIHRSFLFLHNKTQVEDSGVFVVRTTNVTTVSAKGGRTTGASSGPDLSKMNPALLKGGANGGAMPPPPKTFGRDRLIGKTISVRKGPYKGYIGIVKDSTDTIARVELHTKNKIVTVPKEFLVAKDPITGQTLDMSRFGGGRPQSGGRAPFGGSAAAPRTQDAWQGGRTPMASADSSRTPAWGGSSSRTPAWSGAMGSGGGRTPAWKADGSRTAYGGAAGYSGGRTPAWNSGARTPYGSGSGSGDSGFDAFAAGSRTPAHGGGSRTPAWGPGSIAASNPSSHRPYDAPTPGGEYSAPTPGEYGDAATPAASAPTPRAWNDSAPTPGAANAPTPGAFGGGQRFPGAYDAPTPAAGSGKPYDAPTPAIGMGMPATPAAGAYDGFGDNDGDDGGPRYEEGTPSP